MTTNTDTYTRYGIAVHREHRYPVTSSPNGQSSRYSLRVWKSTPGADLVVSIRSPGVAEPDADWHPEYTNEPESEKAALLAAVVAVYQTWEAQR